MSEMDDAADSSLDACFSREEDVACSAPVHIEHLPSAVYVYHTAEAC